MKVQYVRQKHRSGCAIACISMVTGIPYEKVDKQFATDFNQEGIKLDVVRDYVCDKGFSAVDLIAQGHVFLDDSNKRMARPFAQVHIAHVQPHADSEIHHAVVMDKRGRVYDPDMPKVRSLTDYYYIVRVTGFWKD